MSSFVTRINFHGDKATFIRGLKVSRDFFLLSTSWNIFRFPSPSRYSSASIIHVGDQFRVLNNWRWWYISLKTLLSINGLLLYPLVSLTFFFCSSIYISTPVFGHMFIVLYTFVVMYVYLSTYLFIFLPVYQNDSLYNSLCWSIITSTYLLNLRSKIFFSS